RVEVDLLDAGDDVPLLLDQVIDEVEERPRVEVAVVHRDVGAAVDLGVDRERTAAGRLRAVGPGVVDVAEDAEDEDADELVAEAPARRLLDDLRARDRLQELEVLAEERADLARDDALGPGDRDRAGSRAAAVRLREEVGARAQRPTARSPRRR